MNPTNKPQTLSANLNDAADLAEQRAADAIRDGDPEGAAVTLRLAEHLRRLSHNHRAAALVEGADRDPVQIDPA